MSNCLFESAFENILKECKCFPGELDAVEGISTLHSLVSKWNGMEVRTKKFIKS